LLDDKYAQPMRVLLRRLQSMLVPSGRIAHYYSPSVHSSSDRQPGRKGFAPIRRRSTAGAGRRLDGVARRAEYNSFDTERNYNLGSEIDNKSGTRMRPIILVCRCGLQVCGRKQK